MEIVFHSKVICEHQHTDDYDETCDYDDDDEGDEGDDDDICWPLHWHRHLAFQVDWGLGQKGGVGWPDDDDGDDDHYHDDHFHDDHDHKHDQ